MYLVYRIIECNYIGCTKDLRKRKISHKSILNNSNSKEYDKKLYKYISENNLNFDYLIFKILKENLPDKRTAEMNETMFIIFYNSIDNGNNLQWSWMDPIVKNENR